MVRQAILAPSENVVNDSKPVIMFYWLDGAIQRYVSSPSNTGNRQRVPAYFGEE